MATDAPGNPRPCSPGWRACRTRRGCACCASWSATSWASRSCATSCSCRSRRVSRHLKVLGDEGWVRSRAEGTTRLYRMVEERDGAPRRLWAIAREETASWATVEQDQLRLTRRLAARRPAAEAFFAGAAGQWDRLRAGALRRAPSPQTALLSLLPAEWVVADLGCGTGQTATALAPHVRRVVGVDQSAAMLRAARKRTADLPNVELRQGSLEALPLEDESVDGALLILALTYVADLHRVAAGDGARSCVPVAASSSWTCCATTARSSGDRWGRRSSGFEPEPPGRGARARRGCGTPSLAPLAPEPQAKGPGAGPGHGIEGRASDRRRNGTQERKGKTHEHDGIGALEEGRPRVQGGGPRARRVGPQGDGPGRAGDARPDGAAQGVRRRRSRSRGSGSPAACT